MSPILKDIGIGLTAGTLGGEALKRTRNSCGTTPIPKTRRAKRQSSRATLHHHGAKSFASGDWQEADPCTGEAVRDGRHDSARRRRWHRLRAARATLALGWLLGGAIFGTVFYLIEDEGMGPALGLAGDNTKYPAEAHVRGFAAHLAFGLVAAGVARLLGVKPKNR
jgi:hypothetical protein